MSYDHWKTTEPEPYREAAERDDPPAPCRICGAPAKGPGFISLMPLCPVHWQGEADAHMGRLVQQQRGEVA
jgi:hypothetical protein